jgi:hypothetical protein
MNLIRLMIVLMVLVSHVGDAASDDKHPCSSNDARLAETEASSLKTWNSVYESFQRFSQCDDASIGEGYSDSITRILSKSWSDTPRLQQLVAHDRRFQTFVLRHIDELMTPAEAATIAKNAAAHCPEGASELCGRILKRLKELPGVEQKSSVVP